MSRRLLPAAALAALAALSACRRREPPPATSAPPASEPPRAVAWSYYELGSLLVIEGEVERPTRLVLRGHGFQQERDAEAGPVRWELFKPAQADTAELRDAEGRLLATWALAGLPARAKSDPPPPALPANNGPTEDQVAALRAHITWTQAPGSPEAAAPARRVAQLAPSGPVPKVPEAQDLRRVPEPARTGTVPPEPLPRVGWNGPPAVDPVRPRAGLRPPADPRLPHPLPEPTPRVNPVLPPRVAASRPHGGLSRPLDPRAPQPLPEATPRVSAVLPPRYAPPRPHGWTAPQDPGAPAPLPEATPKVNPVLAPRVDGTRPRSMAAFPDPRAPRVLPEPTPDVRPVLAPRTSLPSPREAPRPAEPASPRALPEAARPEPRMPALAAWPGAGEALNLVRGPRSGKRILLTFDGGSSAEAAHEILDTLRSRGIRTTFFLTGTFVNRFPDVVRRIAREGHEIGNHTQNHPHFAPNMRRDPRWSEARVKEELLNADQALVRLLGRPMDPYWRAPYGEQTAEIRQWAEGLGYRHIGWSEGADTLDWATPKERRLYRSGDAILERLHWRLQRDGDGLIVLMHLGSERDESDRPSKGLGAFIDRALREGWSFASVGEYLRLLGKPAWDPSHRLALLRSTPSPGSAP